ncbi:hypothetical protein KIN20_027103 [Parelaphostrongylus tenuis]|uniref:Uncharacterized protein n=1 Tax=Parelaphostrongylus tenuis TaxID=148309 RepID=A0AAD5WDG9_PARTN|nr:hypothetical protein KIN20_027103 [Parelaphostrongylus tenuis]
MDTAPAMGGWTTDVKTGTLLPFDETSTGARARLPIISRLLRAAHARCLAAGCATDKYLRQADGASLGKHER